MPRCAPIKCWILWGRKLDSVLLRFRLYLVWVSCSHAVTHSSPFGIISTTCHKHCIGRLSFSINAAPIQAHRVNSSFLFESVLYPKPRQTTMPSAQPSDRKYFSTKRRPSNDKGYRRSYPTDSVPVGSLIDHLRYDLKGAARGGAASSDLSASSKQPQEQSLKFYPVPRMDKEESPTTSTSDVYIASPLQEHMNKLLDMTAKDISNLVLVPDNARLLPPSFQTTPTLHNNNRPMFSKSLSDRTVMNKSKYRPCRWTSDTSPRTEAEPNHNESTAPQQAGRPGAPPPPPFHSPTIPTKRPASPVRGQQSRKDSLLLLRNSYSDTQPVLPSRSDMDVSEHCALPNIRAVRKPNHAQLFRQTSDSVLARPERRDSSDEFTLNQVPSTDSSCGDTECSGGIL